MWWAKVFASLCIIFDLTALYDAYHHNQHRHGHGCYYQQCVSKRGPAFCKEWCLVYHFDGCRYRPKYNCCKYKEKPGHCPLDERWCSSPFSYHSTKIYQCDHDFSCPVGYKCCQDSCYAHKVCKPCTNMPPFPATTLGGVTRDTEETTVRTPRPITPTKPTTTQTTNTNEATTTNEAAPTTTEATTTTTEATTTTEPTTERATTTEKITTITEKVTENKPTTVLETTTKEGTTTQEEVPTTHAPIATTEDYDDYSDYSDYDYDIKEPEATRRKRKE